jgi:tryptophan synthase beta subunit
MKKVILDLLEEDMFQRPLMPLILEVEKEYNKIKNDNIFKKELDHYMKTYVGRPSPLFFAERNY